MSDMKKGFVIIGIAIITAFIVGYNVGHVTYEQSMKKEITELSIELTKLEIKRLKELSK